MDFFSFSEIQGLFETGLEFKVGAGTLRIKITQEKTIHYAKLCDVHIHAK